jgi:ADP-ribose pyrophosphatase YjhB (NUDIX family)
MRWIALNINIFRKLSLGVDCVILSSDIHSQQNCRMEPKRALQVLLIKRTIEPFNNMWSIPGGLVEEDKTLEETLNTRLLNKLNLENMYKEQLRTYGDNLERDPRGRVVTVAYIAAAPKNEFDNIRSSMYGEVKWFWVELDRHNNVIITDTDTGETVNQLAFDHGEILRDALIRIKNKIAYSDILFKVMPSKFTMRELQDVYENILGKTVYSFRKLIGNRVVETDDVMIGKAHRPAKLYTFNKEEQQ